MPRVRDARRYDLDELARQIERTKQNEVGAPASFSAFEFDTLRSVLETCIDFHTEVPMPDRDGLIWQSASNAATAGVVTAEALLTGLDHAERAYLRSPIRDYILATSITVNHFPHLTSLREGNNIITFSSDLPRRFRRTETQEGLKRVTVIEHPERLMSVRIRVKARTEHSAANQALDCLDFFRGLWNYNINWRTRFRQQFGIHDPEPINKILLGPVHTLHSIDGSLATQALWHQPQHIQSEQIYDLSTHWSRFSEWQKIVRRRLRNIPYASEIKKLFIRYNRALDNVDYEVAFSKLWAVLEQLTNAPGKYDDLVKRVLFLVASNDRAYTRLILEHLRDVRNGLIHDDIVRDPMMSYIFQLKFYIETVFHFHLRNGSKFRSIADAGNFLALPPEVNDLKARIAQYQGALRFQQR